MLERDEILSWLTATDEVRLADLWAWADSVRRREVGDEVHLRGLLEVSNYCRRACEYCGLSVHNHDVERYRMGRDEIVASAELAERLGYGSVVLQAGEDARLGVEFFEEVIRTMKQRTSLAVTLSLGERPICELERLRRAGADRYLLRFETSNRELLHRVHPPLPGLPERVDLLRALRALGFEVGSGVMVGLPGTCLDDLANDLLLFRELELDMIGVGPFIAHPRTPLGRASPGRSPEQVPADVPTTCKVIALARLLRPGANIPATTALATLDPVRGRELALSRGANVCMPNITPQKYRDRYEIYPDKACMRESAEQCDGCLRGRISRLGRTVGRGPGTSRSFQERRALRVREARAESVELADPGAAD